MSDKQKKANRCAKCGFRIRGKKHEDGHHHQSGSEGRASKSRRY